MFGYVRVNSSELKVKEYELYRASYCGLCRAMGRCTGQCSRMTLSYDFAFLVMLRAALTDTELSFSKKRCFVHPLKKRNMLDGSKELDYCAYAAAVLNSHKLKDDIADERGMKRLRARIASPIVGRGRKKALRAGLAELDVRVANGLSELYALEKRRLPSVDAPAAIFGDILAALCSFGLDGPGARIAESLGRSVGRWIYITDALDDMREDKEKGRYNPFLLLYDGRIPDERELGEIKLALKAELLSAEAAADLIDTEKLSVKNVIENILYLGMPDTVERIVDGVSGKNNKKSRKEKALNERSL